MPDERHENHLRDLLDRGKVRRRNLGRFIDDLKVLADAGFELIWADNPPDLGAMAWKVDKDGNEQSVSLVISVGSIRSAFRGRADEASQTLARAFQTAKGRQLWLKALQDQAQGVVEEAPVPPPTCWDRLLADD